MDHTTALSIETACEEIAQQALLTLTGKRSSDEGLTTLKRLVKAAGDKWDFLRKPLVRYINSVIGILESLNSEESSLAEAKSELTSTSSFFIAQTKKLIEEQTEGDFSQDSDDDTTALLAKYSGIKSKIQTEVTQRGTVFAQAPILPMVAFDRAKLAKLGFKAANMSGYVVLEDQYVLGVSRAYADKLLARSLKIIDSDLEDAEAERDHDRVRTLKTQRRAVEKDGVEAIFAQVLETFLSRHKDYVVVADPAAWHESRWYWVVQRRLLPTLRTATFGGAKFAPTGWGFAFQSTLIKRGVKPTAL